MFVPFVNEAIRVVEEGIASVDDVDKCTLRCFHCVTSIKVLG